MNKLILISCIVALGLTSCLKDNTYMDVSKTSNLVEFSLGSIGSSNPLSWGTLPDSAVIDTAIAVDLSSPQVVSYPVTLTIIFDTTLITQFNSTSGPSNQLQRLPDSCFKCPSSTAPFTITIAPGHRIGKIPIELYPTKIDPTHSYAMPFTIVSATGNGSNITVSANGGNIFYSFIGNPIAGAYTQEWIRYNNAAGTGTPAYDVTSPTAFVPSSPTEITVNSGTGVTYVVDFTNTGGVLSNFTVSFNAASVTAAGITISGGPTIITADPVNHKYVFNFTYLNGAGAPRNITDKFN